MIDADYNDETLGALAFIAAHPDTFYVCGSRWTGKAHNSSDFDFVTEDTKLFNSVEWPFSKTKAEYRDQNTIRIRFKGSVQLILVADLGLRRAVYRTIISLGLDAKNTEVWRRLYSEFGLKGRGFSSEDDLEK